MTVAVVAGGGEQAPRPGVDAQRLRPAELDAAVGGRAGRQLGHGRGDVVGGHELHLPGGEPDGVVLGAGLDDLGQELEELRRAQDRVRDVPRLDLGLLGDLGAQVAAVGQEIGPDDATTARWWPTPAARSAASRLRVEVVKNARTASSSQAGALETSTTTSAPAITSARPSPLMVSTPVAGDAGTASCPCAASRRTTLLPTRPLPPMTTIFMVFPPVVFDAADDRRSARARASVGDPSRPPSALGTRRGTHPDASGPVRERR